MINSIGSWTVPPGCAAWIPAGLRHSIQPLPRVRTRTLYVSSGPPSRLRRFGGSCAVLQLTPLIVAIVDHVCNAQEARDATASKHLLAVFLDQLPQQRELPLFVPALRSPLARRVAEALEADPADTPRIRDLAAELAVSDRTLERTFAADALMSLGEWRQRSRMCRAIALLAAGGTVQDVALEVGYETPSAFVTAFKGYTANDTWQTVLKREGHEEHEDKLVKMPSCSSCPSCLRYFPFINASKRVFCSSVAFGADSRRHGRPGSAPSVTSIFVNRSRRATSRAILSPGRY